MATPLVTYDQFKNAVVQCGFPSPTKTQYENCVNQAKSRGAISSKMELAMFVANVIHETGGMTQIVENKNNYGPDDYKTPNDVPGQRYFGRGYLQLSWHYNYLAASLDLYGDDRLARNPDLVSSYDIIAWATAFSYWKRNVHSLPEVQQGHFGATTNAINGALECRPRGNIQAAKKRYEYYKKVLAIFVPWETPIEAGCYNC